MAVATNTASNPLSCLIVVAPTFYTDLSSVQYLLALETARSAKQCGVRYVVVDGSPDERVGKELAEAGAHVLIQGHGQRQGKGDPLRQGIVYALEQLSSSISSSSSPSGNPPLPPLDALIAFQEPEKASLMRCYTEVVSRMRDSKDVGVLVLGRSRAGWESLPQEQMHSEQFGNLHLRNVLRDAFKSAQPMPLLDWFFGPMCFRASLARYWLGCSAPLWDAQILPAVVAWQAGEEVAGLEVKGYLHPAQQTAVESGDVAWSRKRLLQLRAVTDAVTAAVGGRPT